MKDKQIIEVLDNLIKKEITFEEARDKLFILYGVVVPKGTLCDVCGSDDVIEAPSMGKNCNRCNPL